MSLSHEASRRLRIGIDVGGTFTDGAIWDDDAGKLLFSKVPSTPPTFADGVISAGLEALSQMSASFADVEHLVHSSTVAANVVAEKKGARVGMITTAGFRDVLEIQRTRRDRLYDMSYNKPAPLVPRELRLEGTRTDRCRRQRPRPLGRGRGAARRSKRCAMRDATPSPWCSCSPSSTRSMSCASPRSSAKSSPRRLCRSRRRSIRSSANTSGQARR